MHFVTNKISTSNKVPTLSEVFKAARTQAALDKTASTTGTVKTAANIAEVKREIAAERGNIKNLTAPKFGPGGKPEKKDDDKEDDKEEAVKPEKIEKEGDKEVDSCGTCASNKTPLKKAEKQEEGETSGQPQAEAKLVNDPNKDSNGKKSGKSRPKSDEAEGSGQLEVEPLHQKGESTGEKPGSLNTEKSKEAKTVANALKKNARFQKISELTPKEKERLRAIYSVYWPKSYIDALLA